MADHARKLEVEEDMTFQRRDWTFERAGWLFILFIVVAGLTGLLGHGRLSDASATAPDQSLHLEYGRFERHGAPTTFTVHVPRRAATDSTINIWISKDYLDGVQFDRVVPEPESEDAAADGTVYRISIAPNSDTAHVTFQIIPQMLGPRPLRLAVVGAQRMDLTQFVYP